MDTLKAKMQLLYQIYLSALHPYPYDLFLQYSILWTPAICSVEKDYYSNSIDFISILIIMGA